MKDEINCSCTGGGDAYLLQSVAIHFSGKMLVHVGGSLEKGDMEKRERYRERMEREIDRKK